MTIIRTHPNNLFIIGALCQGKDGAMVFGTGIITSYSAAIFGLLLFQRVIGSKVGRNSLPTSAFIPRPENVLSTGV
jgi:hypothetical protein